MLLGSQKVNSRNHLEIGGCDCVDLAAEFGTPLYVMDEKSIRDKCRAYRQAFAREYGGADIAYASKAFIVTSMCALADQEGMWLDVASAGELYTAKCAGFPMERVLVHGNFKSADELEMAVDYGAKYIVVDSFLELELLSAICEDAGKVQEVLLRCNPGVDPHTHRLISTGQEDSKFGLNIRDGSAMKAIKQALGCNGIVLKGIHCHVGSQLFDLSPFIDSVPIMIDFIRQVKAETGTLIEVLDIGGGLGVRYVEQDNPPSIDEFAKVVSESVITACAVRGVDKPILILEPGRSIVGEAGTTIYTVGSPKQVDIPEEPGTRTYLPVDGGLSDNPRPALYDAQYSAILANRAGNEPTDTYTVCGKHCETDNLITDIMLAEAKAGDLLAVQTTGAYNHSMASNYNRFTRPAVVFVADGHADLVARRENMDDLVSCDLLPERFKGSETKV
ncbi:MAG: diaminopimelate decarboxylase [Armatimonadota bacterium]